MFRVSAVSLLTSLAPSLSVTTCSNATLVRPHRIRRTTARVRKSQYVWLLSFDRVCRPTRIPETAQRAGDLRL